MQVIKAFRLYQCTITCGLLFAVAIIARNYFSTKCGPPHRRDIERLWTVFCYQINSCVYILFYSFPCYKHYSWQGKQQKYDYNTQVAPDVILNLLILYSHAPWNYAKTIINLNCTFPSPTRKRTGRVRNASGHGSTPSAIFLQVITSLQAGRFKSLAASCGKLVWVISPLRSCG